MIKKDGETLSRKLKPKRNKLVVHRMMSLIRLIRKRTARQVSGECFPIKLPAYHINAHKIKRIFFKSISTKATIRLLIAVIFFFQGNKKDLKEH